MAQEQQPESAGGNSRPIPPWEAEQAAAALAELHGRLGSELTEAELAKRIERERLVQAAEFQLQQREAESQMLSGPGAQTGPLRAVYAALTLFKRPEWLLLVAAAFCIIIWLLTRALHTWIAGMTGNL